MKENIALTKLNKATHMLAEAKTLDEVKHILDIAEAARTYAKAAKLGLEAYNHAAEVKVRAERKAGEMLKQLERSNGGRPEKTNPNLGRVSEFREVLEEQDIPHSTAHRWQQLAEISDDDFEQHLEETRGERPITTSGLLKSDPHISYNSGENEWYTPIELINAAKEVMGSIDTDPASSKVANKTIQASKFYTKQDDGKTKSWDGNVWLNPPYAQPLINEFVEAFIQKYNSKEFHQACVLVNNATETSWFQELVTVSDGVCLIKGRVKFLDAYGNPGAPLQGQIILYFGYNIHKFVTVFERLGKVLYVKNKKRTDLQ